MKRYIQVLWMMAGVFLFASCLGSNDEDETEYYTDTAITGFKLSTVNRYIHTTSSSGGDSVYVKTLSDPVTFTIDQYQHKIYNTDSLPSGCDLSNVLASIGSYNSGIVVIKSLSSDSTLMIYNSTDSIDFTVPREIRVYAQDNSAYRAYEVTVNMHKASTDKIIWQKMEAASLPTDSRQALIEERSAAAGMAKAIGYGRSEAYAFSQDGLLMVSTDEGQTWTADSIDDDRSLLPTEDFAFVSYPFNANDSTDYQLLIGTVWQQQKACVVWRKIAEYAQGSQPSKWVLLPVENFNQYYLPYMGSLNLLRFRNTVLAIGNNGKIYESRDQGITWKTTSTYALPDDIGTYDLKASVDSDGYIWLVGKDTGEIWRGLMVE